MRLSVLFLMAVFSGLAVAQDACVDPVEQTPPAAEKANSETTTDPLTPSAAVISDFSKYWSSEGLTSPADADPEKALVLTAEKAVDIALEHNATAKVAQDDVNAARARVGQARSGLLPQVRAVETYSHIEGTRNSMGGLGGLFEGLIGDLSPSDTRRDSVGLTQPLFAGGQLVASLKASKFLAESQEFQKQATLNQLAYDARQAYYDCLLAQAITRVAEDSLVTFERHLADTQQMFDVGLVSNFEVLRAKTEVGSRQSDLIAAQNALELALVNLRRILGIAQDEPIRLQPEVIVEPITSAVDDFLTTAQLNRPELLSLDRAIRASGQNVKKARGEFLPRATANINWSQTDGGGSFSPDGVTFTVAAEWDIVTGGRRVYNVREACAQKDSLVHQREDLARLVEVDVRQAYIQMQDAVAQVEKEKGTVDLGDEGRRLAELRFQEGVGTQVEVLDAELALTNAQSAFVRALRNYVVAKAALDRAVGVTHTPPECK